MQTSGKQPTSRRYQTRQREQIRACLAERAGEYVTAREVCDMLAQRGCDVGMATVYRNLDRMVADGLATRCSADEGGAAGYRMVARDEDGDAAGERGGFYLKCEECGTLVPIRCQELEGFYAHFAAEHHVRIDPVKTILYGTCPQCTARDDAASASTSTGAAPSQGTSTASVAATTGTASAAKRGTNARKGDDRA